MKPNPDAADALGRTLFILGRFPPRSQTFIHREFLEMRRRGYPVNLFAETETVRNDLRGELLDLRNSTLYRGSHKKWVPCSLILSALKPKLFKSTLDWALSLPHRTRHHRVRFLTALLTAVYLVPTVKRRDIGYLHAHFAGYQTEIAMCLSKLTGLPYGATWHAYGIYKDRNILEEKICGSRVVMTCTKYNANHLRRLAKDAKDRIKLVYHGIDCSHIPQPDISAPGKVPLWIAIGRLIPKKGFDCLIRAAALLRERGEEFELNIVGSGELEDELNTRIRNLDLSSKVRLLGAIPNERVFDMLGRSTGLVVPSVRDRQGDLDGIPNVILEAMAMSKPIIGSDLSGIPEAVKDGKTGVLVPSGDVPALADAMAKLGGDPTLTVSYGEAGRALLEEKFDLKSNLDLQISFLLQAGGFGQVRAT